MNSTTSNTTRSYRGFDDAVDEVVDARVYSGIHFRKADVDGAVLGRDVAHDGLEAQLRARLTATVSGGPQRLKPPETSMFSPVIQPHSSDSRAAMTLPMSSPSPRRPSAVRSRAGR